MLAEITGMGQGSITVELQMIPRKGESVKIMYGPDAELEGEVVAFEVRDDQGNVYSRVPATAVKLKTRPAAAPRAKIAFRLGEGAKIDACANAVSGIV